jgi:hypothetical protein
MDKDTKMILLIAGALAVGWYFLSQSGPAAAGAAPTTVMVVPLTGATGMQPISNLPAGTQTNSTINWNGGVWEITTDATGQMYATQVS